MEKWADYIYLLHARHVNDNFKLDLNSIFCQVRFWLSHVVGFQANWGPLWICLKVEVLGSLGIQIEIMQKIM